jgi:hypothetical protein
VNHASPYETRCALLSAGFSPLPINGKAPPMRSWQKISATPREIARWDLAFPAARNTGFHTHHTPTLDADVMHPEAAAEIEAMVRERFEEHGFVLTRIGRAPKRCFPFRTDAPFKKLTVNFTAPDGRMGDKLEMLGDGQQVVAFGQHKDTGKPYRWHGGEPGQIRWDDLPFIDEKEARRLIDDAARIVEKHGYTRTADRPKNKTNGQDGNTAAADWSHLTTSILEGRALHDSLLGLAGKLVASGMSRGAVVNYLRGLMQSCTAPHDERWQERFDDIPRLVEGADRDDAGAAAPAPPCSLEDVYGAFRKWLGHTYDIATLEAMLATCAAERLTGDPPWLMIISGPGNAKTETVQATSGIGAHVISTIASEGALLSATPRKSRSKAATGGLLRKIGDRGVLSIKDFTSIISADRNIRQLILAALREIHDGHWVRNVGSDGGQTLEWKGRVVIIGACTTAWDQAHAVISIMGDRFILVRSDSSKGRLEAVTKAIGNTGNELAMRQELAAVVAGLIGQVDADHRYELTVNETDRIMAAANIVTLARTGVELDYRGDVIDAHAPEMPTRCGKQLAQIMRGGLAIGLSRPQALALALRCARDSTPPLRLAILEDVAKHPDSRIIDVRRRLQRPRATVDRALQALHTLGLLTCREEEKERADGPRYVRHYTVAAGVSLDPLSVPDL